MSELGRRPLPKELEPLAELALDLRLSGNLQVNNGDVLREAALAGMGIALLPIWCVAPDLEAARLSRVLPQWQVTPTTFDHCIYAVYQRSRHVPPKIRAFVDFMAQALRRPPAGRGGRNARNLQAAE